MRAFTHAYYIPEGRKDGGERRCLFALEHVLYRTYSLLKEGWRGEGERRRGKVIL
jgi:hypothetical protein